MSKLYRAAVDGMRRFMSVLRSDNRTHRRARENLARAVHCLTEKPTDVNKAADYMAEAVYLLKYDYPQVLRVEQLDALSSINRLIRNVANQSGVKHVA